MIKLLIGGSPCTFWSIAQKNNRETEAKGLGWELFKNYLIAKEKFKPDFFLYENNKSASQAIKEQISKELGVDLMYINSALVSAQNRQRFYAFNWEVEQPEDRGILLRDVLETEGDAVQIGYRNRREADGKLYRRFETSGEKKSNALTTVQTDSMVAQLICHTIPQEVRTRKYTCNIEELKKLLREHKTLTNKEIAESLTKPITLVEHWFRKDNCFSIPDPDIWLDLKKLLNIETNKFDDFITVFETKTGSFEKSERCYDVNGKMSTLMAGGNDNIIAPVRVGQLAKGSQGDRVYSIEGKSVGLKANGGGWGAKTGLYAIPTTEEKENVYIVENGLIEIKGRKYPIKLEDGFYIIRKLTPIECERLQTLPDNYTASVSNNQRYKGLGNGWTAEVIIHILTGALKDIPRDEEIVVLSMYDGIGTGRYCLDKMGFTNVKYFAYEIDKYAKQISMSNYPDIIQKGDAFALRDPDWTIGY